MFKSLIKVNYNFILAVLLQSATTIIVVLSNAYINTALLSEFPKSWLPYYYFIATAVTVFSALILVPILTKETTKPVFYFELICGLVILVFNFLVAPHSMLISIVLIVSLLIISAMFSVISWNTSASAFDIRAFKKAANWFTVINALSGAVIGTIVYFLIKVYSHSVILTSLLFCIAISTVSLYFLKPLKFDLHKKQKQQLSPFKYSLYIKLALFMCLLTVVYTFIDYFFKLQLSQYKPNKIAEYTTIFFIVANVLTAIAETLSSKVLGRFGLTGLLMCLPLLAIIALIPVSIYPNLTTVSFLLIGWLAFYYSYTTLGRQLAINILPSIIAKKSRFYDKAYFKPLGILFGAICIWIFGYQHKLYSYEIIIFIILAFVIYLIFKIKKDYSNTLYKSIDEKRFYLPLGQVSYDKSSIKNHINEFFKSSEADQILLGFSLMKKFALKKLPENIHLLISHHNTAVKLAAIKIIELFGDDSNYLLLSKQLEQEKNPLVIWAIVETLLAIKPDLIKANINRYLVSSQAVYRAAAIASIAKYGDLPFLSAALLLCYKMIDSKDYDDRLWATKALGHITVGNFDKELSQLIYDSNQSIAIEAIRTCEKLKAFHLLPSIVNQIGRPGINHELRKIILRIGGITIPHLVVECKKLNLHQTKPLIRILCAITDEQVEDALIDLTTIDNNYFAIELAKQIAIRALRLGVTKRLKDFSKNAIYNVLTHLELLTYLVSEAKTDFQRQEVILRKQGHEKCLLYWLAVCTEPEQVLRLLSILSDHQDDELIRLKQSRAIEFLDTIIADRTIAKLIFSIIDAQAKKRVRPKKFILADLKDPWLIKVFSFKDHIKKVDKMEPIEKVMILRATSIFEKLPAEILLSIAEEFVLEDIIKDQIIFEEQSAVNGLYVLTSGEIGLYHKKQIVCTLKPKECVGIIGLFDNLIRPLTAKAITDGSYLFLNKEVFERLIDDYPDIMREAIKVIIRQFRSMLEIEYGTKADVLDTLV